MPTFPLVQNDTLFVNAPPRSGGTRCALKHGWNNNGTLPLPVRNNRAGRGRFHGTLWDFGYPLGPKFRECLPSTLCSEQR